MIRNIKRKISNYFLTFGVFLIMKSMKMKGWKSIILNLNFSNTCTVAKFEIEEMKKPIYH